MKAETCIAALCLAGLSACATVIPYYGEVGGLPERDQARLTRKAELKAFARMRVFQGRPKWGFDSVKDGYAQALDVESYLLGSRKPPTERYVIHPRAQARAVLWLSGKPIGYVPGHEVGEIVNLENGKVYMDSEEIEALVRPKPGYRKAFWWDDQGWLAVPATILDFMTFPFNVINIPYFAAEDRTLFGSVRVKRVRGRVVHSADTIIDNFEPEEFQELMATADYQPEDLELEEEDIEELRAEGYLGAPRE